MSILTFYNLRQSFAEVDIFSGLAGQIPNDGTIALVGPNGIGKTTLLQILAGVAEPSEGQIHLAKGTRIGYLRQEAVLAFGDRDNSIHQEMLRVFKALRRQETKLRQMEAEMQAHPGDDVLLTQYGQAQEAFELAGGYDYELWIQQTLTGLGFGPDHWEMPLNHCSGGQKTRALLARLLLEKPDLLILDEPTNHLDVEALEWLESRLRTWQGAMLIVSHDRYFLDNVVNIIWEMSINGIETYRGNYSHYLTQREARWERRLVEFQATQETFLKELDYVKRNIARDSTRDQAKGRLRRLVRHVKAVEAGGVAMLQQKWSKFMSNGPGISSSKWGVADVEQHIKSLKAPNPGQGRFTMRFSPTKHQSEKVLEAENLVVGYPNTPLFTANFIELHRGACAALIGGNGTGKTTFLRTLLDNLEPQSGWFKLAGSLKIGYFAQAHDTLDPQKTVLETVMDRYKMLSAPGRDYLARFLFQGEDVYKPVSTLSGGERGRLALALLAYPAVNLLILDEPTNHLDIPTQEVLQNALENFEGTILLVTHDRYLVNRLANQIWSLEDNRLHIFEGDYQAYLAEREAAQTEEKAEKIARQTDRRQDRQAERAAKRKAAALAEIETRIHDLESDLETISKNLEAAGHQQDWEAMQRHSQHYQTTEAALEALMAEWETLAD